MESEFELDDHETSHVEITWKLEDFEKRISAIERCHRVEDEHLRALAEAVKGLKEETARRFNREQA